MRKSTLVASSLVALAILLVAHDVLASHQVPFRGQAQGSVTAATPVPGGLSLQIQSEGTATGLGRFTRTEQLLLDPVTSTFTGLVVFTAANGDELSGTVQGGFVSQTSATGTYTFTGGTGRFQGATGSATFALTTPDGANFEVEFAGSVSSTGHKGS